MKYLDQLRADPRVSSVSDERSTGDGIWIYLRTGFDSRMDVVSGVTTYVHEQTIPALRAAMLRVVPVQFTDAEWQAIEVALRARLAQYRVETLSDGKADAENVKARERIAARTPRVEAMTSALAKLDRPS